MPWSYASNYLCPQLAPVSPDLPEGSIMELADFIIPLSSLLSQTLLCRNIPRKWQWVSCADMGPWAMYQRQLPLTTSVVLWFTWECGPLAHIHTLTPSVRVLGDGTDYRKWHRERDEMWMEVGTGFLSVGSAHSKNHSHLGSRQWVLSWPNWHLTTNSLASRMMSKNSLWLTSTVVQGQPKLNKALGSEMRWMEGCFSSISSSW